MESFIPEHLLSSRAEPGGVGKAEVLGAQPLPLGSQMCTEMKRAPWKALESPTLILQIRKEPENKQLWMRFSSARKDLEVGFQGKGYFILGEQGRARFCWQENAG